jgi:hypothetical protein
MGENQDIRRKLEAQKRALREHEAKERQYTEPHDKEFARKTQQRIKQEIADLERRLNQ